MNPVDVLKLLGQHGYRVIGFTAESDQKMVWTLEQNDFEQLAEEHNSIHHWKLKLEMYKFEIFQIFE